MLHFQAQRSAERAWSGSQLAPPDQPALGQASSAFCATLGKIVRKFRDFFCIFPPSFPFIFLKSANYSPIPEKKWENTKCSRNFLTIFPSVLLTSVECRIISIIF